MTMKFSAPLFTACALALACAAAPAAASGPAQPAPPLHIEAGTLHLHAPYAFTSLPGVLSAAGYVELRNTGQAPDRLLGAASPVAARVELHDMQHEGGVMRMREVTAIELPPGETVRLAPNRLHLMFIGLKQPLVAGEPVPLTLKFERAGKVSLEMPVRARGDLAGRAGHGQHGNPSNHGGQGSQSPHKH